MAREAIAVQARPMTLAVLTQRIRAAVEPQGLTAKVAREGDSLVVDLMGAVCPDPLLAMMSVEAELEALGDLAGLEAVKLYGHVVKSGTSQQEDQPGWMSVIDLDGYFAQRAVLPPTAFGLIGAAASRKACEAERHRYSTAAIAAAEIATTDWADQAAETEAPETEYSETEASATECSDTDAATTHASATTLPPWAGEDSEALEDPWDTELAEDVTPPVCQSLDHFPRISPVQLQQLKGTDERQAGAQAVSSPQAVTTAVEEQNTSNPLASGASYECYQTFIAEHSSWFAQTVKDDARLHNLAKQRQHRIIRTLANYLVNNLAKDERLVDLVPVRKQKLSCGLIFTDQRVIGLSQPTRRRDRLAVWTVPWSSVHKVEICHNAFQFHCERIKERFSVDLEAPYHLRNSIPRDIPVRMVREIFPPRQNTLNTKAGLMMVAGVMFALGSGFSLLNNVIYQQHIEARSNSLDMSHSAIQLPPSTQERGNEPTTVGAVAASLAMTTNHEQCVSSFNSAAQPHAYATLNQVTQTMQVNLQNQILLQMPQQQFNEAAASVAQEILSSCQAKVVNQVVVTNGVLRYQQQRSEPNFTSVKTRPGLSLF